MSSGLSDKKNGHTVTEPLGGAAALGAQVQPKVKPVQIWAFVGAAILVFQLYVWIRWITGPNFERVPAGVERSADADEGDPLDVDGRDPHRLPDQHLLLHRQALAARAANHARRHAPGGDGPDVLPGPITELLQHLEHLQHLDVESGLVGTRHSGLAVARGAGPHDGRTTADECAGLLVRSSAVHDPWMLGHAQGQGAMAEHQQPSSDRRSWPSGGSSSISSSRACS